MVGSQAPSKELVSFAVLTAFLTGASALGAWFITDVYPTVALLGDLTPGIGAVSVLAGLAAFFSPCAFGLLPAYFGFYLAASPPEPGPGNTTALKLGMAAAAGITVPGIALAALVATLGPVFARDLPFFTTDPNEVVQAVRLLLGTMLILLGIAQLRGRAVGAGALSAVASRLPVSAIKMKSPLAVFFLYGLAYFLASVPCTSAVMVAPLLFSLAVGGVSGVAGTAMLIVLTMATLMILSSVLIGLAKDSVLARARPLTPDIQRASGLLVIAMGAALIYLTVQPTTFRAIFSPFTSPGVS